MRRALAVVLLVLAACGGGDDDDDESSSGTTTTTSTTAGDDDGTTTTEAAASDDAEPGTTVAPADAPGTTAPPAGDGDGLAAPEPVPPGTYRFRQSGSASGGGQTYNTPPEGTMKVDPPTAGGEQTSHRYVDPEGEPIDTTFRFGVDGMFILETVLRQGGTEIRCTFEPPLAAPPWPPDVGRTFEGTGQCGAFTAHVEGSITGTKTVELDGRTYDAVIIDSKLKTTGQFESEGTQLDWFVPELRLSAHQETTTTGKFGEISFESKGTSDLISAVPS